jgi:hypothetical protein
MTKKSGTAGTPVEPTAPVAPHEADNAEPGAVEEIKAEQRRTQSGKYGLVKAKPFQPPAANGATASQTQQEASAAETSWIEIELVGEDDQPIPGERYKITLPDGRVDEGTLDQTGWARVAGFAAGQCQITFPELDQEAWSFIESTGPRPREE